MKKVLGLVLSLFMATALSADVKAYIGGGFGFMATPDVSGAENGVGLTLKAGAKGFVDAMPGMGALIELNKSLSGLNDGDVLTFAAYASYDIEIPNSIFAIRPKFGLILPNSGDEVNSRDLTFSSGIGATMSLNDQIDLYVDYAVLGEAVTNYSLGVEFTF